MRMKMLTKILSTSAFLALPVMSIAHPGHGHENPLSPGHYFGNPEHVLPLALTIAVAAVFIVWKVRTARNAKK
jgi:hypothetical protein